MISIFGIQVPKIIGSIIGTFNGCIFDNENLTSTWKLIENKILWSGMNNDLMQNKIKASDYKFHIWYPNL